MSKAKFLLSSWLRYCAKLWFTNIGASGASFGLTVGAMWFVIMPNMAHSEHSFHTLISKIPSLYVASVRQPLYPTPLKKSDQVAFHDEKETLPGLSVVLDRVVFIPRYKCASTC